MTTPRPALQPPAEWHYPAAREATLTNGIRVLVHDMPGQQVISAILVLDVPLHLEDRAIEGVATVCARALDEGTQTHPGDRFAEVLETEGAAFGANQAYSGLQAMIDVPATRFEPALELLADAVRRPELRDSDCTRHVALRLAELDQQRANSAHWASWGFRGAVFDEGSRVQRLPGGEPASVAAVTPEAVRDFHRRHYGPAGATLVLAGEFPKDPVPLAEQAFGDWMNPEQDHVTHLVPGAAEPTALLLHRPGAVQADLRLGGFGIDRHDPRWPAFQVGTYAVGGAFLSRLNKVLREERGYTYGVGLQSAPLRHGGSFAVAGSFRTEVLVPALEEARALLDVSEAPVTAAEVTDAVNYFTGVSTLRYATAAGIADQTASTALRGLPLDYIDRYLASIRATSPDGATAAYRDIIDLTKLTLVVAGDADELADPLAAAGYTVSVVTE
ncbi:M16 family metallopeptidase [Granulicoccus sp. GXG6511]|uniref:M16 family metallopeptidase n=1 Tax=Granulicoccus sp. GXG6511 TaxID=3381351 RepID=UPI003D7C8D1D